MNTILRAAHKCAAIVCVGAALLLGGCFEVEVPAYSPIHGIAVPSLEGTYLCNNEMEALREREGIPVEITVVEW